MRMRSATPLLPCWSAANPKISRLRSIIRAQMRGLVAFVTTCLVLLPVEYRTPIEMALIAVFPQYVR